MKRIIEVLAISVGLIFNSAQAATEVRDSVIACLVQQTPDVAKYQTPQELIDDVGDPTGLLISAASCLINAGSGSFGPYTWSYNKICIDAVKTPSAVLFNGEEVEEQTARQFCMGTLIVAVKTPALYGFLCKTETNGGSANTGHRCFSPEGAPAYGAGVINSTSFGFVALNKASMCIESAAIFPGASIQDGMCIDTPR
jgi:hypothetical protein